ncbi:hypothetical protein EP12_04925 [Alteromonas australica]|jgi:hypothetical protein|uniref:Uncharacterized protein n=1 Tax=Alteromonas australica TaxID=589873 RepID=A0A075NZP2_9ALTE|nr:MULTISPECIES: hypothetical protein [Alteromonas]AIF98085.1 hypothetical protein EP13_04870 [Alteromonas australica]AJP43142.1 hypothetical protein EP12_04925 [Alteromonas australica]QPL49177.1 hypothetical protein IUA53_15205 [Alteromonas sp. B31-7]
MNLTAIFIVGIVCWSIVAIIQTAKGKSHEQKKGEQNEAYEAEITALKERVSVLEKIVTDEKYDLNKQFDALKKDKVA